MKWEGNRESSNIEDRRSGGSSGGGGLIGRGSVGIGTVVLALAASYFFGVDPMTVISVMSGGAPTTQTTGQTAPSRASTQPPQDEMGRFVSVVLADTEDVWGGLFQQGGARYIQPKLVLYKNRTATACGTGSAAMGPFYCPGDQRVYLDLDFFNTLKREMGAGGEFAQAYVIAHEVGHHVQHLMGITGKVDGMRGRVSEKQMNALSVRVELQADCFAGVWAHHADKARQILENGDVESAINAAAKIGDDALQKRSQGYVVPDSFTHGTSAQRVRWFNTGLQTGSVQTCDTFNAASL